jgi:dihydrofolate synthase/folylpolyglutamate synthase
VGALRESIDEWFAAGVEGPRAISDAEISHRAATAGVEMRPAGTVTEAMAAAARSARPGDRVVVFGSFHTVGPALATLGIPL